MNGHPDAPRHDVLSSARRGVVAAMAMSGVREMTTALGLVRRPPPDEVAAEGLPELFAPVPERYRDAAIEAAHWGYGASMGIAYGLLPRGLRQRRWVGPAYGLATWALFERVVAPALALRSPAERPARERAAIALDHVLYGAIVAHPAVDPGR